MRQLATVYITKFAWLLDHDSLLIIAGHDTIDS